MVHHTLSKQLFYQNNSCMNRSCSCGGHFYAESGIFSSDGTTGCEWLLRAPVGKGIILDFGSIPSVSIDEAAMQRSLFTCRESHAVMSLLRLGKERRTKMMPQVHCLEATAQPAAPSL